VCDGPAMPNERAYLDHAATTPMRPEVLDAMLPWLSSGGNPSSLHAEGRRARAGLDDARARVAAALGGTSREIVFVSGGSEADDLAIAGVLAATAGARRVVTTAVEHRAVLAPVRRARDEGVEVELLPVDRDGRVQLAAYDTALERLPTLVSMMLANNEIGTVQPIAACAVQARERGVLFHCDAVQAPGRLPLDVRELGVDFLSIAAHKCYGPLGIGALYVRAGTPLRPQQIGGSQESGRRAGTESVAAAVGFAVALELAQAELASEAARLAELRNRFEAEVLAAVPGARALARGVQRLPHLTAIAFPGADAALLAIALDLAGLAVSTGSACASGAVAGSHVLVALGDDDLAERGTVRFSFGRAQAVSDASALAARVAHTVAAVRDDTEQTGTRDGRTPSKAAERSVR